MGAKTQDKYDKRYNADKADDPATITKPLDHPYYDNSSAELLAQEGDVEEPREPSEAEEQDWSRLRSHLETRLVSLRMWRNSWWTQNWSTLAEYLLPRRSIWLTQSTGGFPTPNNMTRGRPINGAIKDPTGTYASRVCAAGLMSGLASPSRPWFKTMVPIKNFILDDEARQWLDEVEDRIYAVLAGSNFYNAFAQECEDLVVFGTGPSIIYEDKKDVIRCYNPVVGEYYLGSSATLRIDALYRDYVMTVSQIVGFFGIENCPPDIQGLWKQKGSGLDIERIVAHAIEPNYAIDGYGKIPGNFTWREVFWVYGSGSQYPLSKAGFMDVPFTAARWSTQSNDAYGRSPGMDVLPDVIQLQVETMRKAEGIEKGLRPPLLADMTMKNQPSSILPGHITYVQNLSQNNGMRSIYNTNFDLDHVTADLAQIQQRIKVGLFNDLFMALSNNAMTPDAKITAYQSAAIVQEKMAVVGPVIENLITESLKPKLKRIFAIAARRGMLPKPPKSMQGVPIDITFVSMLALAQKAAATGGLDRMAALMGELSAVYPNSKYILDEDQFIREYNDLLGNPAKILRGPERVQQMVDQANKAAQAAQQQQAMAQGVDTAKTGADAAQVLANTPLTGGQTALSSIFGGAQ